MSADLLASDSIKSQSKRFISLDFARGIAIFLMLFLHIVQRTLDRNALFANINDVPMLNLLALILIPFFGGLAGFFLLVSSASNMVSFYRDLEKGRPVRGLVLKQIVSGLLLLIFAFLNEGIIGYNGILGSFFWNLNDPSNTNWQLILYRWNFFETIHTIAWCIIINGCIQGLLSLKNNWKNYRDMIISYIALAVVVVCLTQPIWDLVDYLVPGYPFGLYPSGNELYLPEIGTETFWQVFRAPFLNALAAPMEPIFPYLAISFIGSVIGIVISQPKEQVSKKFPRNTLIVGAIMFIGGLIGIFIVVIKILNANYITADGFDAFIELYMNFPNHRAWDPDFIREIGSTGEYIPIPMYAWFGQFFAVNGFSLMLLMLLFRLVEFRGKSKTFAKNTKIIRRFGTVAFTNYNNQWIFFIMFFLTSLMVSQTPYKLLPWYGVFIVIILTYSIYSLILFAWEKVKYTGSLEWVIRTITNNIVPERRKSFNPSVKWWQKGQIDVDRVFYNVNWVDFTEPIEHKKLDESTDTKPKSDSKFALILSIIGLASILFILLNIVSLVIAIRSRKSEGKNKQNIAALIISIIGVMLLMAFIIVSLILPIGVLGLF
ncbi:MAG: DUF1624 domain-containing protein [Candidatus Heimdallarchaeota archaeon]|nr:DUF1624 domain-containing protein [Candidatus Heimdallarchaeota archaeon]